MVEGKKYYEAELYDEAQDQFEKSLRMKKNNPEALEWLAYTYEKKNVLPQALNAWNTLLRNKDLPQEKRELVQACIRGIMVKLQFGAEATAESLVDQGKRFYNQKLYDEAGKRFLAALSLTKNDPEAIQWLAYTYEKKKMYPQALNAWKALTGLGDELPAEKRKLAEKRITAITDYFKKRKSGKN